MRGTRLLLAAAASLLACGPSFQAVYECDVHFEHCYALDESAAASVDSKKECWHEWLRSYTYGQSRDRVEYGGTRYSQLSLDPTLPSEDVKDATRSKRAVVGPVPTSAFAPPPNVIEGHPATAATASEALVARAPGAECADGCAQRWTTCRSACRDGACDPCDVTYRTCVPGCFRDDGAHAPARTAR